ncbi:hypothetical protein [Caproiciproducens sp.]
MPTENIIACLDQKVILLTQIWDLTKQIDLRCTQDDIQLDGLLEQRGVFIDRINKCNDLIGRLTAELPPEQRERVTELLNGKGTEEDCGSEEERHTLKLSKEYHFILQKAAVLDQSARGKLRKRCDELREKINQGRRTEGQDGMFQSIK